MIKLKEIEKLIKNVSNISIVKELLVSLSNVTDSEQKRIIDCCKKHNYSHFVCTLFCHHQIKEFRSIEQMLQMADKLGENVENEQEAYWMLIDTNALKFRTLKEHLMLVDKLKQYTYDELIVRLAHDANLMEKSIEKQLGAMDALHEKQVEHPDASSSKRYADKEEILKSFCREDNFDGMVRFKDSFSEIYDLKEMEAYIQYLEETFTDIGPSTLVPTFQKVKKMKKSENYQKI